MADMNKMFELANSMFGSKSAESSDGSDTTTTKTIIAEALSDSHDGIVKVYISDGVILDSVSATPESSDVAGVDLPTTVAVEQGDEVLVSMFGSRGALTPVVTGVVGNGDKQKAEIAGAADAAQAASDAAADASQEAKDATATSIFAKNLASNADTKADSAQAAADTAQGTANSALQTATKVSKIIRELPPGLFVGYEDNHSGALIGYDGGFYIVDEHSAALTGDPMFNHDGGLYGSSADAAIASLQRDMATLAGGQVAIIARDKDAQQSGVDFWFPSSYSSQSGDTTVGFYAGNPSIPIERDGQIAFTWASFGGKHGAIFRAYNDLFANGNVEALNDLIVGGSASVAGSVATNSIKLGGMTISSATFEQQNNKNQMLQTMIENVETSANSRSTKIENKLIALTDDLKAKLDQLNALPHIVETGQTPGDRITWEWEKYSDGRAHVWGIQHITICYITANRSNGTLYWSNDCALNWPFRFVGYPTAHVDFRATVGVYGTWLKYHTEDILTYAVWSTSGNKSVDCHVSIDAWGRWK